MITLRSVNNDSLVKTTLVDGSVLQPTLNPIPVGFSYLQPFFSAQGQDNVITRFTDSGSFDLMYGSDLDNVKRYGHGGLVARHVLSGGGILDACRLMPSDAKYASMVLIANVSGVVPLPGPNSTTINGVNVVITAVPYDYTKTHDQNFAIKTGVTIGAVSTYTSYPLIAVKVDGRGTYGNDIGFRIYADPSRSGAKTGDGRRYIIEIWQKNLDGSIVKLGDNNEVISFSFDQNSTAVAGSIVPDAFDTIFDQYAKSYSLPVSEEYDPDNYTALVAALAPYTGTDPSNLVDFITGYDLSGNSYAAINIVTTTVGAIDTQSSSITYLTGGTDGDMFDNTSVTILDPVTGLPTGATTTKSAAVRQELLIQFYTGDIDDNLFDPRIIDAGVTLDAWWPTAVKGIMASTFGAQIRDDIFVILDTGDTSDLASAQAVAKTLAGDVSHPYGSVGINIHNGQTTDRARNIRTTGNYDIAYSLPNLYNGTGAFTVLAGFVSGRVKTMAFDILGVPKVVKNDLQIQPLRDANLLFAMKIDRSGNTYYMSDASQYATQYSVLGSMRNLIFAGEVIRDFKKVLAKYSFFPGDAPAAIPAATSELKTLFAGSFYPVSIPVTFSIIQTRNDIINGTATVNASIQFPNVINAWKVTIVANRTPIKA